MDRSGNIVDKDSKFGEAIDLEITHPNYILFGGKTGCNILQKKDGPPFFYILLPYCII
jgi:hypothetical protein